MAEALLPWAGQGLARAPGLGSHVEVLWDEEDPETGSRARKWWKASLTVRRRPGGSVPGTFPEEGGEDALPTFDLAYLPTESYEPSDEDGQVVVFKGAHVLIDVSSGEEFLFRLPGDTWEPSPADYEAPPPLWGDEEEGGEAEGRGEEEGEREEGGERGEGRSSSGRPESGTGSGRPESGTGSGRTGDGAVSAPPSPRRARSPPPDSALTLGDLDALIRAREEASGQSVDEACLRALGEISDARRILVAARFREFADVVKRGLEGVVRERGEGATLTADDVRNMLAKRA